MRLRFCLVLLAIGLNVQPRIPASDPKQSRKDRENLHSFFNPITAAESFVDEKGKKFREQAQSNYCSEKYSSVTLDYMRNQFFAHRNLKSVFVAVLLKDAEPVFQSLSIALLRFARRLTNMHPYDQRFPEGGAYISILESESQDLTPKLVKGLASVLTQFGISHVASVSEKLVTPVFDEGDESSGYYQEYHAKLRNTVLQPFFDLHTRGKEFDKVVFIDNTALCEGDIWRLLTRDADMACGLMYGASGLQANSWVFETDHIDKLVRNRMPEQVFCCWNSIAVLNPEPLYKGVRFRWVDDQCMASEKTLYCKDMHRLGFNQVLIDPMVKVQKDLRKYGHFDNTPSDVLRDTPFGAKFVGNLSVAESFRCCGLNHPGVKVNLFNGFEKTCSVKKMRPPCGDEIPSKCLGYTRNDFKTSWDWNL